MLRSLFVTSLIGTALAAAIGASPARAGRLVDLAVVDRDTGRTLPAYFHDGKTYVAGTPGHRYAVRLTNRSGGRVLTILSVDGVNAVSGETASTRQSGYVLDPRESTDVLGWRKSLDEIAQFNFTALPDSYAARTGRPANVGVIGVAVFTERAPVPPPPDVVVPAPMPMPGKPAAAEAERSRGEVGDSAARSAGAAPSAAAGAPRPQEKLGTGHGEREVSQVGTTQFERATRAPAETLTIYYDSYANLVRAGVIRRPQPPRTPDPFPGNFVPDPPRH
jgi:hypothetical protein